MNIFINILVAIICFLIGYLFGSIPNAVWIGKVFFHKDPREYGSKNAGATNAGRLFGKKVGFIVILLDIAKAVIPIWGTWSILTFVKFGGSTLLVPTTEYFAGNLDPYIIKWPVYWIVPIGTMIGHCWPIFAKFVGGKAVTVYYTSLIGTTWLLGIPPFLIVYMGSLKLKKYVSLSALITALLYTVVAWTWAILVMTGVIQGRWLTFPSYFGSLCFSWHYAIMITLGCLLVVIRHKSNISRLKDGTESKIKWMK